MRSIFLTASNQLHSVLEGMSSHPFLTTLAKSRQEPRIAQPIHKYRAHLRQLEEIAKSGDLQRWNQNRPQLYRLAQEAGFGPFQQFEMEIQLRKMELDLLLAAKNLIPEKIKELESVNEESLRPQMDMLKELAAKLERSLIDQTKLELV